MVDEKKKYLSNNSMRPLKRDDPEIPITIATLFPVITIREPVY
jgi:hypothetical protein